MEKFELLIDHIYRLWVPFDIDRTSVFLIRTDDGDILFDAATTAADVKERILPALAEIGSAPVCLVMSHDHSDHAGGMPHLAAALPNAVVCGANEKMLAKMPGRTRLLQDGDTLPGGIVCMHLPGHSADAIGLFDTRTKTLLSADCLQQGGVAKWGTGLAMPARYLETLARLGGEDIENIIASHGYVPCGAAAYGKAAVAVMLTECAVDVKNIREYIGAHPGEDAGTLAKGFNETHPGHPPISGYTAGRFLEEFN